MTLPSDPLFDWEDLYRSSTRAHKNEYPNEEVIRFVFRNFQDREEAVILDLGCGWGNNLRFVHNRGHRAMGIDGSKTACRKGRFGGAPVLLGDLRELPLRDDIFDAVIDRNSAQCNTIEGLGSILSEVARVLKSGGRYFGLILAETNKPENFHAKYLRTDRDSLSESNLHLLFSDFTDIQLDTIERTFGGRELYTKEWKIQAVAP